jgi:hypothetical protein
MQNQRNREECSATLSLLARDQSEPIHELVSA